MSEKAQIQQLCLQKSNSLAGVLRVFGYEVLLAAIDAGANSLLGTEWAAQYLYLRMN